MTPSSSVLFNIRSNPIVTATLACLASRPVANAFGASSGIIHTCGFGSPAVIERFSTILCKSVYSFSSANSACAIDNAILSEYQKLVIFITTAKIIAIVRIN